MSMKIEVADRILEEKSLLLKEHGIVYLPSYEREHSMWKHYQDITLQTSPLLIDDSNLEYNLSLKVANEMEVTLGKADFGRGEDETNYRNVFFVNCLKENDIETGIKNIIQAKEMLNIKLHKVYEFINNM